MPTCTTPGCRNPVRKRGNWKTTEPVSAEHAQQARAERDALKAIYLAQLKRRLARRQKGRPG